MVKWTSRFSSDHAPHRLLPKPYCPAPCLSCFSPLFPYCFSLKPFCLGLSCLHCLSVFSLLWKMFCRKCLLLSHQWLCALEANCWCSSKSSGISTFVFPATAASLNSTPSVSCILSAREQACESPANREFCPANHNSGQFVGQSICQFVLVNLVPRGFLISGASQSLPVCFLFWVSGSSHPYLFTVHFSGHFSLPNASPYSPQFTGTYDQSLTPGWSPHNE